MIILDTSFLVSVEVETDQNHKRAVELRDKIIRGEFGDPIISDYIFDEAITVTFQKTKDLKKVVLIGAELRSSAKMINVDEEIFELAWELFKDQDNTRFSFTDCTILSIARLQEIKYIATFDKDFDKVEGISVIK